MSFFIVLLALALLMFVAYHGFSVIIFAPIYWPHRINFECLGRSQLDSRLLANLDRGGPMARQRN